MNETFGNLLLSVNSALDRKTFTYTYYNKEIPCKLQSLKFEFKLRFSRWLTSMYDFMDGNDSCDNICVCDFEFLELCTKNIENISNENLDWYTPSV